MLYQILSGLEANTTYSLQATIACSDGSSSLPSNRISAQTLPNCLGRGDRCEVGGPASCCEGGCILTGGPIGVCGYPPSPPPPSPPPPPLSGYIFTFAGNGTLGFSGDGSSATSAGLFYPGGIAIDTFGNVYIADTYNSRVRKVFPNGTITTFAGNGTAGNHTYPPAGPAGGPPLPLPANYTLPNNTLSVVGDGGPATNAAIYLPSDIAIDTSGNVYISDQINARVRKVTNGTITTFAGNGTTAYGGDGGPATNASLDNPSGLAFDSSGNLYISERFRVRKVFTNNDTIITYAGNGSVSIYDITFNTTTITGTYGGDGGAATSASLYSPGGLAFDAPGNLYIADNQNNRVRKVYANGTITTVAGNGTPASSGDNGPALKAALYYPSAVALDAPGNLYISTTKNVVRKVSVNGSIITTVVGNGTGLYFGDNGPATRAGLPLPAALAFENTTGNLLISAGARVRIVYGL